MPLKPNFKIYQGILALELQTPHGRKWWAQGYNLGYTPYKLTNIQGIRAGLLEQSQRRVLAVRIPVEGQMSWVAVNAPRSDIPTLIAQNLWPQNWPPPYNPTQITYTPWPEDLS